MNIGFHFPTQAAHAVQWLPGKPPVLPARSDTDYPDQLTGETAGGTLYVQNKGPSRDRFELTFERLAKTDRDAAWVFFTVVNKAFHTFEYQDVEGVLHTVRWFNAFALQETVPGRYSGTIHLRKE